MSIYSGRDGLPLSSHPDTVLAWQANDPNSRRMWHALGSEQRHIISIDGCRRNALEEKIKECKEAIADLQEAKQAGEIAIRDARNRKQNVDQMTVDFMLAQRPREAEIARLVGEIRALRHYKTLEPSQWRKMAQSLMETDPDSAVLRATYGAERTYCETYRLPVDFMDQMLY